MPLESFPYFMCDHANHTALYATNTIATARMTLRTFFFIFRFSINPGLYFCLPIIIQPYGQAICHEHCIIKRKERQFYQNYRSFMAEMERFACIFRRAAGTLRTRALPVRKIKVSDSVRTVGCTRPRRVRWHIQISPTIYETYPPPNGGGYVSWLKIAISTESGLSLNFVTLISIRQFSGAQVFLEYFFHLRFSRLVGIINFVADPGIVAHDRFNE